jgi:hypothetical protein
VIDPERMAKLYGVQELEEYTLGQGFIPDKVAFVGDV